MPYTPEQVPVIIEKATSILRTRRHVRFDKPNDFGIVTPDKMIESFQGITSGITLAMVFIAAAVSGAIAAGVEVPLMLRYPALTARFGPTRLLIAGAGFLALRSLVAALATEPLGLLVASAFAGCGYALFFVGGVTYVSNRVPPELAATAQGIFQGVGSSLSQVTAALLGGAIAALVGIQGLFAIASVLGIAGALIVTLATRRQMPPHAVAAARPPAARPPAAPPPAERPPGPVSVESSRADASSPLRPDPGLVPVR